MAVYPTMPHMQGNLLCAIDLETTGTDPLYHDIIQIAVVPVGTDLKPIRSITPFYLNLQPINTYRASPDATRVHKLDLHDLRMNGTPPDRAIDMLERWHGLLDLPFQRRLIPLAHKFEFEHGFLTRWLGMEMYDSIFHPHARDAMRVATAICDKAHLRGESPPFNSVSLPALCAYFRVENQKPHDALHDCFAEIEVYRHLLQMGDL